MVRKLAEFARTPFLPWALKKRIIRLNNVVHYCINILSNIGKSDNPRTKVAFVCGFHGETGGTIAIANVANLLSQFYQVTFFSYPESSYNRKLLNKVKISREKPPKADLYICDASCGHEIIRKIRKSGKQTIVSCHGLPDQLHGLDPAFIKQSLNLSTLVHFVSPMQQRAFHLDDQKCAIIPNTIVAIEKKKFTNNIGTVGNLDDPRKGAKLTVEAGVLSNADEIHLWGTNFDNWAEEKVRPHQWENNKQKIYDSFDLLVFLSKQETFGLVVIEAMSAGIPCILRRLPAFEQYIDCPGIVITESEDPREIAEIINELLVDKERYREPMKAFFEANYSGEAVLIRWQSTIQNCLENS